MELQTLYGERNFVATSTIRSTETRQQCWMEWLLNVLYEGQEGRGYFATGTGLHSGFEWLIKGVPYDVAEEMVMEWIGNEIHMHGVAGLGMMWTKTRPEETWEADVARLLSLWYDMVHPDGDKEYRLTEFEDLAWPPKTEVWLDVETPDFHLRTQVDAIFGIGTDHPTIVDWKTGANKGSDDRQLHVYWWAAKQMGLVPEDAEPDMAFYYVHHKSYDPIKMPYPGDEEVYDMIARAEEQRRRGRYHVEPSWKCRYCQVTDVCPAWADNDSLSWPELMELATEIEWDGENT